MLQKLYIVSIYRHIYIYINARPRFSLQPKWSKPGSSTTLGFKLEVKQQLLIPSFGFPIWSQVLVSQNVPYIKTLRWNLCRFFFVSSHGEEAVSHALCCRLILFLDGNAFGTDQRLPYVFSKLNQLNLKRNKLLQIVGWNQGTFRLSIFTKKSDLNLAGKRAFKLILRG